MGWSSASSWGGGAEGGGGGGGGGVRSKSSSGKVAQELATAKQENAAIKGALIEACTELEQVRMPCSSVAVLLCWVCCWCLRVGFPLLYFVFGC